MPRTQAKPTPTLPSEPATAQRNGPIREVLTLSEAASYLRLSETDVLGLVAEQGLPTRQVGSEWRFLKAAIQDWLRTNALPKSDKDAWTALAGVWKDDPYMQEMLKGIHKQRGRTTEDES